MSSDSSSYGSGKRLKIPAGHEDESIDDSDESASSDSSTYSEHEYRRQKAIKLDTQVNENIGASNFENTVVSTAEFKNKNSGEAVGKHATSQVERFICRDKNKETPLLEEFGMQSMFVLGEEDGQIYEMYAPIRQ